MLYLLAVVATTLSTVSTAWWMRARRHVVGREKEDVVQREAVRLVRTQAYGRGGQTTDDIVSRLIAWFVSCPPTQEQMAALSLAQQRCVGQGGETEYAVVTVYAAAMYALCGASAGRGIRRTASAPSLLWMQEGQHARQGGGLRTVQSERGIGSASR